MSPKQLSARAKLVAETNQLVKDYGIRAPFNFTYREVNPGHFLGQVSLLDQLIESKVATKSAKTAREEAAKEALLQIGSIRSKLDEKMRSKGIRDYSSQGSDSSLNLNRSSGSGSGSGASASTITSTSLVSSSSSSSSLGSGADAGFVGSGADAGFVGSGSVGSGFIGSGSAGSGSAGSGFAGSGSAGSDPAGSGSSPTGFAGSSSSSGSGPAGSGSFGYSGFAGSSSGSGSGSGPGPNAGPSTGFNTGSNTDSNTGPDTPSQKSTPDPSQKSAPRKVTPGPSQAPVSHGVQTRSAVKKPSPPTKRLQAPPDVIGSKPSAPKPSAPKPSAPKSSPTKIAPTKVAPLKVSPPKVSAPKQSGPVNLNSTKIISDNQQVQHMDIVEDEIDPEEIHAVEKAKRILTEYLKFQSEPTNLQKPAVDLLREFAEAMPCQEPMYQVSEDLTPHPRYLSPCYSCVVTMENFTVCTEDSMPTCSLAKEQCASLALLILARTLCPPDVYKSLIGTMENEASYRRYTLTNGERLLLNGAGRYDMSVLHEALVKLGWSIGEMTYMERDGLYVCHLDIDRNPAPSMRSSSKIWAATKSESADVAARDLLDQMESGNLIVVSR